jgi:hypothetical protein
MDAFVDSIKSAMDILHNIHLLGIHQCFGINEFKLENPPIKLRNPEHLTQPPLEGSRQEDDQLLQEGIDGFVQLFGFEDDALFKGKVGVRKLRSGTYVLKEDADPDPVLIYVLSGTVSVFLKAAYGNKCVQMFSANAGDLVGGFTVFSRETFFTVDQEAVVAMLPKATFYS